LDVNYPKSEGKFEPFKEGHLASKEGHRETQDCQPAHSRKGIRNAHWKKRGRNLARSRGTLKTWKEMQGEGE